MTLVLVINSYKSPENVENLDSSQSQSFLWKRGVLGDGGQEYTNICVITIWSPGNATKAKLCFQARSNVCLRVPGTIRLSKQTGQQFPVQLFSPHAGLKPQGQPKLIS